MKSSFIFILAMLIQFHAFSQTDSTGIAKNILYGEAFGAGGYGSINYERIFFTRDMLSVSARVGLSTYHVKDFSNKFNPDMLIPIAINGFYGNEHKAEFGIGQTIASIVKANNETLIPERTTTFSTFFSAGYRYQKKQGGLFLRIVYTPIIDNNERWTNWGGLSVGYIF